MSTLGALVVLALGAAEPAPEVTAPPFRTGKCAPVAVSSPQAPRARQRFSAASALDLRFQILVRRGLEGPHTLTLKLYTPNGHLYQELLVPFRAQSPPHERASRGTTMTASLPVAGTAITTSGLFGRWRVEPHLDGSLRPCGSATRFLITR
jgi:hypothetical protein